MILLIGYGNSLRSDDGIGQRLAAIMERRLQAAGEQVNAICQHQLMPELVEPIRHARQVIFIDARVGETPGLVSAEVVTPAAGMGAFTHNASPSTLLGAAQALFGATPKGILISIVGADFGYGSELSPQLVALLPEIADQVEGAIIALIAQPDETG